MIYIEEGQENSAKNDLVEESKTLAKNECLLQAIKDFSRRYDNDSRKTLKNKKLLVNFDDLMTLIKETIDFQNKIIGLNTNETDKMKDIAQDFINNLSYTIFSFEKIDISNKEIFSETVSISNESKTRRRQSSNSLNPKRFLSNNNLSTNIQVNKKKIPVHITKRARKSNSKSYTKINRNNINIISVNNNQTSNEIINNKSTNKKEIININSINNYTNKFTENNNFIMNSKKSTSKKENNINDTEHFTAKSNRLSSSTTGLIFNTDSGKINNEINTYSSVSIPNAKYLVPKKVYLTQGHKNISKKNSDKNFKIKSFKEKKTIKTKNNIKTNTLNTLNNTRNKNVEESNKTHKTNIVSLLDNNYLFHNVSETKSKKEKNNDKEISKKESKSHKETIVYCKDNNGEMKFLYKKLIDIVPKPSSMASKFLENSRKYVNDFNEMKKEEEKKK